VSDRLPIAPNGVFSTVQGECSLAGIPMHFVRLAGCSVGCKECDTDYTVAERLSVAEIVERLQRLRRLPWVWLTGGEPTDHPIGSLVSALQGEGYRVALATAGVRQECKDGWRVGEGRSGGSGVDCLSVSPHFSDDRWVVRGGTQLNVVPGLNGLDLQAFTGVDKNRWGSMWVTPVWDSGRMARVDECVKWVLRFPHWRVNTQAHKFLQVP
jgi:7-carboxy-7-deazaguanine synthase